MYRNKFIENLLNIYMLSVVDSVSAKMEKKKTGGGTTQENNGNKMWSSSQRIKSSRP